jgi:hypothetical protein
MLIGLFGTGRNGSSLIGRLLDGLQDTYVHPVEELFLTAFDDLAHHGRLTRLVIQNCTTRPLSHLGEALSQDLLARYYRPSLDLLVKYCSETVGPPQELRSLTLDEVLPRTSCTVEEFTRGYLEGIAARVRPDINFRHHLFKSIEVAYLADYERRFPDMKFVHIVRDPVAVCSSQKRSLMENKGVPASYLGYDWLTCMLDKRWLPHAQFVASRRGDPRHILVRYEDLVAQPVTEIGKIADGLGLSPPPRPTTQTVFHDLDKTDWGANPSKKGVDSPTEVVADLQERNRYEEVLTQREIDLIAVKTRDLLPGLSYRSPSEATSAEVRRQYLVLDKWELMHCGRSPRYLLRGLIGLVYRRAALFRGRL